MRAFIAIELGAPLCARVDLEVQRLSRLTPQARWVKRESLHLTLAFLGEISDPRVTSVGEALARVASRHLSFPLRLQGSGTFGRLASPKVLWVGFGGEVDLLRTLQRDLAGELLPLGLAPDHDVFEPHVTLARAKHPRGTPVLGRCADTLRGVELGELTVTELVLFSSRTDREGMRYTALTRAALGAAGAP